jgi:UDP-hydrolysing UDP-N-acetyl-D-glucosamine 2-epimerase
VLTTGRQDYGILRSSLLLLRDAPEFELILLAGGMHLSARFGNTIDVIRNDGLVVHHELDFLHEPPEPCADVARAALLVGRALTLEKPDALLLVGDRSETLAAGLASTVERVPIVHLHGGEESEGAIDNAQRHALTKLSHLHLVSHELHAQRVRQMGEAPESVVVVGAPGLDNMYRSDLPGRETLEEDLGLRLQSPLVLVTMHPATLEADPAAETLAVSKAMETVPATYIVTQPNADAGGEGILNHWRRWVESRPSAHLLPALGDRRYWALLQLSDVVLGNSSSGIIEAPAAAVPSIDVGARQKGRLRYPGAVHVPAQASAIAEALYICLDPTTREKLQHQEPLFPAGPSAPRVVAAIREWKPERPPRKLFHRFECDAPSPS